MNLVTAPPLAMTDEQRAALETMTRSTTLGHRKVVQAKALLLAAEGVGTNEVARRCHTSNESVRAWRRRFEVEGVDGVGRVAKGRGRKSWLAERTVAGIVHDTLHEVPDDGSTHWTTRLMAKRSGVGKDTVARIWRDHNPKPWKTDIFKRLRCPIGADRTILASRCQQRSPRRRPNPAQHLRSPRRAREGSGVLNREFRLFAFAGVPERSPALLTCAPPRNGFRHMASPVAR